MIGRLPGNAFVFVEFEDCGGVLEFAALMLAALELDVAELVERLLELAGESCAVEAEAGEELVGVDDVESRGLRGGGRGQGAVEYVGFEEGDAAESPGGIGEFLNELGFGGGCRSVLILELAAVVVVS
jgi:hypothetical protein